MSTAGSDVDTGGEDRVHKRWTIIGHTFTVHPGATPRDVVAPAIDRLMDYLYQLDDGDYRMSIAVFPVGYEAEAYDVDGEERAEVEPVREGE